MDTLPATEPQKQGRSRRARANTSRSMISLRPMPNHIHHRISNSNPEVLRSTSLRNTTPLSLMKFRRLNGSLEVGLVMDELFVWRRLNRCYCCRGHCIGVPIRALLHRTAANATPCKQKVDVLVDHPPSYANSNGGEFSGTSLSSTKGTVRAR